MADEIKKYLDHAGLTAYDEKIKKVISDGDAKALQDAKDYADELADNYDAAGTAQTKVDNLANGAVKDNTDAIAKLNGDSSIDGSVDKKVADAINTFATQITDDGTINTYKEILNYIATHGGEAAEMSAAIDALETLVGSKSVAVQISEAIDAENLSQYSTDEELAAAIARIVAIEGKESAWDSAEQNAKTYADDKINDVKDYVGTIPSSYTEENVIAYINKKAEETLASATGGSSESAASVLAALNTYKSENDPKVQANTDDISEIKTSLASGGTTANAIADAKKAGTDASAAVVALENGAVKDNADAIADLELKVGGGFTPISTDEISALFD